MVKIGYKKPCDFKVKRGLRTGDIYLGKNPHNNCDISIPAEAAKLNLWCLGPPGSGKSVLLKLICQELIISHQAAVVLVDWHGDVAESVLQFCSRNSANANRIIYFDPAEMSYIMGFNPVKKYPHQLLSERIGHLVDAVAQYMQQDVTDTPRLQRWLTNIFHTALLNETTFFETKYLCDFNDNELRERLLAAVTDDSVRNQWQYFNRLKLTDRRSELESSLNRLVTFVSNERLRCMLGTKKFALDFNDLLDNRKILILNLSQRGILSQADASLLASLFLHELITVVRSRSLKNRRECYILADEFHNYGCSPMVGDSFNSDRKFGLRWLCFHQTPAQLRDRSPYVYNSAQTGLQNKIIFGGLPWDEAEILERDFFAGLHDLKRVKDEIVSRKIMEYLEETRIVTSRSESHVTAESWFSADGEFESSGNSAGSAHVVSTGQTAGSVMQPGVGFMQDPTVALNESISNAVIDSNQEMSSDMRGRSHSSGQGSTTASGESHGESVVPVWVPQFGDEVSSRQFYNLEELRYRNIARMKNLPRQQALCKILQSPPLLVKIRNVNLAAPPEEKVHAFKQKMFAAQRCFGTAEAIEAEINDRRQRLLQSSPNADPTFFED